MKYPRIAVAVAFGLFLILHGIAHSPAVLGAWGLVTVEDVSYQPNIMLTGASDLVVWLLGGLWLVAAAAFVVAGIAVILRRAWWLRAATVAVLVSLPLTILWWEDAIAGLAINAVLIVVLAGAYAWSARGTRRGRAPGGKAPSAA